MARLKRDTITYIAGLGGVFYETVVGRGERPYLLAVFASMIGLPAFLDVFSKTKNNTPAPKPAPSKKAPAKKAPAAKKRGPK